MQGGRMLSPCRLTILPEQEFKIGNPLTVTVRVEGQLYVGTPLCIPQVSFRLYSLSYSFHRKNSRKLARLLQSREQQITCQSPLQLTT